MEFHASRMVLESYGFGLTMERAMAVCAGIVVAVLVRMSVPVMELFALLSLVNVSA